MNLWPRRTFLAAVALSFGPVRAQSPLPFAAFLQTLWPAAQARGVRRPTFDSALTGLSLDAGLRGSGERQAEFERTIEAYMNDAASPARVARGKAMLAQWNADLTRNEASSGVPREIVLAVWGMETGFGANTGDKDVLRSLASLAYLRTDGARFADEVIAGLLMIERGVARERLRGSWAGAMGHPQFLPSAYLKYAVSAAGSGTPDIWNSVPDALASIATFLRREGWKPGLAWGTEVIVPALYDWKSLQGSAAQMSARGVRSADARALPPAVSATLYFPAGAAGPAFLLSENYWILKQYNNSDSYAMSVAHLGDRIAGRGALRTPWPGQLRLLGRADRVRLQNLLHERGFYDDKIDGRFGPASRDAIHAFQVSVGMMPADGFASREVLERLAAAR